MPSFYKYRKASDQYTVYQLQLPEPAEDQPGMIDLGEIDGETYVCVPDWTHPLPEQPKQITLTQITPTQGLITSFFAKSGLLQLVKARMDNKQPMVRYSLQDELTLAQCYDWLPPSLERHVDDGRIWAK